MVKQCRSCHQQLENDAFCPNCGLAQYYTKCNTPFERGGKFCGTCGAKRIVPTINDYNELEENDETVKGQPTRISESRKTNGPSTPDVHQSSLEQGTREWSTSNPSVRFDGTNCNNPSNSSSSLDYWTNLIICFYLLYEQ